MDTFSDRAHAFLPTPAAPLSLRKYSAPTGPYPPPVTIHSELTPTHGRGSLLPMPPNYNEGSYWTLASLRILKPISQDSRRRAVPVEVTKVSLRMDGRWGKEKPYVIEKRWDEWVEGREQIVQKFPETEAILPKLTKANGFLNSLFTNSKRTNNIQSMNTKELNHFLTCLIEKCSKKVVNSKIVQDFFQTDEMRSGIFQVQYDDEESHSLSRGPHLISTQPFAHGEASVDFNLQAFRFPERSPKSAPRTLQKKMSEPNFSSRPRAVGFDVDLYGGEKITPPGTRSRPLQDHLMVIPEAPTRPRHMADPNNAHDPRPLMTGRALTTPAVRLPNDSRYMIRPGTGLTRPPPPMSCVRPTTSAARPATSAARPAITATRPTTSAARPPPLNTWPATSASGPMTSGPRPATSASRPLYDISPIHRVNVNVLRSPSGRATAPTGPSPPTRSHDDTQLGSHWSPTQDASRLARPGLREFKSMQDIRGAAANQKPTARPGRSGFADMSRNNSVSAMGDNINPGVPVRLPTNPWRRHRRTPSDSSSSFGSSSCHLSPVSSTSGSPTLYPSAAATLNMKPAISEAIYQKACTRRSIDSLGPSPISCDGSNSMRLVYDPERRKMIAQNTVPPAPFFPIPPLSDKAVTGNLKKASQAPSWTQQRPHTSAGGNGNGASSSSVMLKVLHPESNTNIILPIQKGSLTLEELKNKVENKMMMTGDIELRANWKIKLLMIDQEVVPKSSHENEERREGDGDNDDGLKLLEFVNGVYKECSVRKITMRIY